MWPNSSCSYLRTWPLLDWTLYYRTLEPILNDPDNEVQEQVKWPRSSETAVQFLTTSVLYLRLIFTCACNSIVSFFAFSAAFFASISRFQSGISTPDESSKGIWKQGQKLQWTPANKSTSGRGESGLKKRVSVSLLVNKPRQRPW